MNDVAIIPGSALTPLFQQWSQYLINAIHGTVWRDGSGPPSDSLGLDGDYYIDNDTGNVYSRLGGTYSKTANIIGPQGPAGSGASGVISDKGGQVFNVQAYGAVANGIADCTSAINSAIAALLATSTAGGCIYFPPGKYLISSTIDVSQKNSIVFMGAAPASTGSPAASRLIYTASSGSMFTLHGIRNVGFRNLALEWNNASYNGTLIDYSQSTAPGNTAYGFMIDCHVENSLPGVRTGPAYLVNCDSGFGFNFIRTTFYGGQYAILGRANSSSFNNCTMFEQCNFEYSANPPILNPHQAWAFRSCVFEPIAGNASGTTFGPAGAITFNTGCPCNGLTVQDCWIGDDTSGSGGTWITLIKNCEGVRVLGGFMSCNNSTTGIKVTDVSCSLEVSGIAWAVGGSNSIGIDFGTTTGHSFTSKRCGNWNLLNTAINLGGNQPSTTFISADYETGGAITIVNPSFSGSVSATNLTATNTMTGASGTFGNVSPNLLTVAQADFENSVAGWASNNSAQTPFTSFATSLALHGGYVLQVSANSNVSTILAISNVSGSAPGYSLVAATPNTNYYAQASFRAPSGQPTRIPGINIYSYDNTGAQIGQFATANNLTLKESTSGWLTLTCNGTTPANAAYVGLILQWQDLATITRVQVVSNVCTVTANNDFTNGQLVDIVGLTTSGTTGINGTNYTVANATSTTFQITTSGVADINVTASGTAKGHLTVGETHWVDCAQISTVNTLLWQLPGSLTVNFSGGAFGASTNLLTTAQADFEGASASGWTSSNSAILTTTANAHLNGSQCLQCTASGAITNEMSIYMGTGSAPGYSYVAASPNTQYYAIASFLLPAGQPARTINLSILAYDSTGVQIGTSGFATTNNLVTKDSSTWTKMTCNGISPTGTAYIGLFVQWHDSFAITNVSLQSNIATLTTGINHDLTVSQTVKVAGCTNTQFNGTFTVTAVTSNTFSYALTGSNLTTTGDTTGNVKGNMTPGEVHYLDCTEISATSTTSWSLPGTSVSPAAGVVQSSAGSDMVVGANGPGATLYLSPFGTGTGGTIIGDGNGINPVKVSSGHFQLQGGSPSIATGPGAGTSGSASITGSDQAGYFIITAGNQPSTGAVVATITFGNAFSVTPRGIILTPGNGNAAALSGNAQVWESQASRATTGWVCKVGSVALTSGTPYTWNYQVMG